MSVPPRVVGRDEVRRLVAHGAQLVDVLPTEEYAEEHIAGALSLPLKTLDAASVRAVLDPDRPVITYCHDYT